MNASRIIGIVLLLVGVVLVTMAFTASRGVGEQVREGLTGRYSAATTWYMILGFVGIVAGAALAIFGGHRRQLAV